MKMFADDSPPVRVRWFRAPEGAKVIPYLNSFMSHDWDDRFCDWPLGEQAGPRAYNKGGNLRGFTGQSWCGGEDEWLYGLPSASDPAVITLDKDQSAPCCGELKPSLPLPLQERLQARTAAGGAVQRAPLALVCTLRGAAGPHVTLGRLPLRATPRARIGGGIYSTDRIPLQVTVRAVPGGGYGLRGRAPLEGTVKGSPGGGYGLKGRKPLEVSVKADPGGGYGVEARSRLEASLKAAIGSAAVRSNLGLLMSLVSDQHPSNPPSIIGSTSYNVSVGNSATVTLPLGANAGDRFIIIGCQRWTGGGTSPRLPPGFTEQVGQQFQTTTRILIGDKVAAGGETGTVTITFAATGGACGYCLLVRNIGAAERTISLASSGTSAPANTLTPVTAGGFTLGGIVVGLTTAALTSGALTMLLKLTHSAIGSFRPGHLEAYAGTSISDGGWTWTPTGTLAFATVNCAWPPSP